MPATRTRAQRPYVPYAYSSSSSESSVLDQRTPFPYLRIPKISLLDYGRLLSDEDTFDEVMATIGHRRSLVSQSKTIRHLWLTSRCLCRLRTLNLEPETLELLDCRYLFGIKVVTGTFSQCLVKVPNLSVYNSSL
jgi:hypothetical protein